MTQHKLSTYKSCKEHTSILEISGRKNQCLIVSTELAFSQSVSLCPLELLIPQSIDQQVHAGSTNGIKDTEKFTLI